MRAFFWFVIAVGIAIAYVATQGSDKVKTVASAVAPEKGFCASEKPATTGSKPLVRLPADKAFAEAKAVHEQWFASGLKAVNVNRATNARLQLEAFHGEAECPRAAELLYNVRYVETAAVKAKLEADEQVRIANDSAGRKGFADDLEVKFLKEWRDAKFRVSGDKNTTLKMTYILVGRPFVHNLYQDTKFFENAKARGFKRLIFTDGYDKTWDFDLVRDKWNN